MSKLAFMAVFCIGLFALAVPAEGVIGTIDNVPAALTGEFSPVFGGCAGQRFDDQTRTARGYVTVNTMNQCTVNWPGNFPGYFLAGGSGEASNRNLLWGAYFYVHPS
ncbi:MAG TPA: hypothetical protein VM599_11480 [Thermoanaerobaculia bacterium]|nr:hypothetical protein [Thermoanaerobaculia bacterium]